MRELVLHLGARVVGTLIRIHAIVDVFKKKNCLGGYRVGLVFFSFFWIILLCEYASIAWGNYWESK